MNYISAPGLAWDALLLKTKINLDLITDIKVLDIIERPKRGGLCFVGSKRHVKCNNKYIPGYDEHIESDYLLNIDANNLYGKSMSQYLPAYAIKLNNDITLETILNTADNDDIGYIVECDLTFPKHLHDKL